MNKKGRTPWNHRETRPFIAFTKKLRLDAVDPLHNSRNLTAGFALMNDAFGGSLTDDGNSHFYRRGGGFLILLLNGLVNSLENAFDPCLTAGVSHSSFFILARPFQG